MKRKVIFLDIDGVLNTNDFKEELTKEYRINLEKVGLMASLVGKTKAEIVLHSAWRFWFDKNLRPIEKSAELLVTAFEDNNIKIVGVTPDLFTEEIRKTKKFSKVKANEIKSWLMKNPDVVNWIVIDDLDLNDEDIRRRQIKPDSKTGLTEDDIKVACKLIQANEEE